MSDRQETYIYESPDGGHTVFRRPMGGAVNQRELHSISDEKQAMNQEMEDIRLWTEIRRCARSDPALQALLDQVKTFYTVKYAS